MARVSKYADKREELLALIAEPMDAHGKGPTIRDLAANVGVGLGTMHSYLHLLQNEGMVEWRAGKHRSLRVTQAGLDEIKQ